MKKLLRIGTGIITAAGIGVIGLASSASATSYHTGPWSNNYTSTNNWSYYKQVNNNNVNVKNYNNQNAYTGHASVIGNTFGGSAMSGAATNWNSTSTSVYIYNH